MHDLCNGCKGGFQHYNVAVVDLVQREEDKDVWSKLFYLQRNGSTSNTTMEVEGTRLAVIDHGGEKQYNYIS